MGDDYESLPAGSTLKTHLAAGCAAGIMEHSLMYPVDCVKTRMQVLVPHPRANYRNVPDALVRIVRYEGFRNTLRGVNAVISGAGPAHAMYFACYEQVKKTLSHTGSGNHLVHGFAGCCATVLHDTVMNPAEVIKQRMQVYNSPYRGCIDCFRSVLRSEGIRAFYRSYTTTLTMNIPFQSLHFMVYEYCQDLINKERHYDPLTHMVSGGMAGGFAAAMTTPLDVCKTLLNTQDLSAATRNSGRVEGMFQALKTVYRMSGVFGFFKGVTPRVLYVMPGTAISWSVYEFFKYVLTRESTDGGYVSPSSVLALPPPEHTGNSEQFMTNGNVLSLPALDHAASMPQIVAKGVDHLVKEVGQKQKM